MARPKVHPVLDADLDEFCRFLHDTFDNGWSLDAWRGGFTRSWCPDRPNHGFVLRDDAGRIVGAIGAIYGTRKIRDKDETFCNITSWYVLDEYKSHSMRLAIALTSQPRYHYTDFTPTKTVTKSLQFLKFASIDARQIWLPNLPAKLNVFAKGKVVEAQDALHSALNAAQAQTASDHLGLPWCKQIVIRGKAGNLLLFYKLVPVQEKPGALVLSVSDRALFTRYLASFQRYLLTQGIQRVRFEKRFVIGKLLTASAVRSAPRKLFLSESLGEADIDSLYSEVVAFDMPHHLV
jgi:hypothetical protein